MKKIFLMIFIGLCFCLLAQGQTITVTLPHAGDPWCKGGTYTITWTKSGTMPATVSVKLRRAGSPDSEISVETVTSSTPNPGSISWVVPASVPTDDYFIRVRASSTVFGDSGNFHIRCTQIVSRLPQERVPPFPFKFPRLEVSDIDLAPNTDGFGIIFSYKNTGKAPLPKASDVPVKPSYRVLIDGRETTKGFLSIPAFAAPPGWEQTGYFGGWIVFPTTRKGQDTRWYIGNTITVYINENKVMGMESHSLSLNLKPIALKYKYDLLYTALSFNWDTHVLTVLLRLDGQIPSGRKILVYCGRTPFGQDHFGFLIDANQHYYSLNKKLNISGNPHSITLSFGTFVCVAAENSPAEDMDFRNNEWFNCKFVYPNSNPVI